MAHSAETRSTAADAVLARMMQEPVATIGRLQLNCAKHGPFMAKGTRLRSRDIWGRCGWCIAEAAEAEREELRIARLQHETAGWHGRLREAGVPARFAGRTMDTFRVEMPEQERALGACRAFVEGWEANHRRGAWMVFSGPPGTGKSHLAIAILQALLPRNSCRYMTCGELIQNLRSTWRKGSEQSELELLADLTKLSLLVLDEVGVQYGTESEQIHLFDVLDRRYREMQPTILLTNQSKDGFREFVGDRVYDRMTEVARWVPFAWASYRPTARREIAE